MTPHDDTAVKRVGFIGLGKMGHPMAGRLLDVGFSLNIWNRTRARMAGLSQRGAKLLSSPREVASRSDVIITMVFDDAALEAVVFSEDGILAGISAPGILIEMSTVSPDISRRVADALAERGSRLLCAPVSGSVNWAESGKLTILASGDKRAYDKCQDILKILGQNIFYIGSQEEARYLKLAHNMIVAVNSQALAEAVTLCRKAGLNFTKMSEFITNSVVASPIIRAKMACLAKRDFSPTGTVRQLGKDLDLAIDAGGKLASPMPAVGLARQLLSALEATGRGELDYISLVLLMEELSGMKDLRR